MALAISHKIDGGQPQGWTPLHILCSGSDVLLAAAEVCEKLLAGRIVDIRDFDSIKNDKVVVFFD